MCDCVVQTRVAECIALNQICKQSSAVRVYTVLYTRFFWGGGYSPILKV